VWDVRLRCAECGPFRFLLIERMEDVSVREQVTKEVERHGRRHRSFARPGSDTGHARAKS
jgi:hypothetical protein